MLTETRYRAITGDTSTSSDDVTSAIVDAVADLEEYLDRPLAQAERTEAVRPDRLGMLWPKATPLVEADGYVIDGAGLRGPGPFGLGWPLDPQTAVEVTYTGGWVPRYDDEGEPPTEGTPLPACIERDLAWAVHQLTHPQTSSALAGVPQGATSVRLGDAAVTYGPGGAGASARGDLTGCWSKRTRSYRYVPVHTGPIGVPS